VLLHWNTRCVIPVNIMNVLRQLEQRHRETSHTAHMNTGHPRTIWTQSKSKSKLYFDRQSVGQSVLVSGTHLGPATNFSLSLFDYFLDSFGFVDVGRPLWREVGSVLFSFCQASPVQPFSDLSPTGLMSIVIVSIFETPPTWRARFLYLFPPGTT
jgi:hypothetical protein